MFVNQGAALLMPENIAVKENSREKVKSAYAVSTRVTEKSYERVDEYGEWNVIRTRGADSVKVQYLERRWDPVRKDVDVWKSFGCCKFPWIDIVFLVSEV